MMLLYTLLFMACLLVAFSVFLSLRWIIKARNRQFRWHVIHRPPNKIKKVERLVLSFSTDPGLRIPKPWGW